MIITKDKKLENSKSPSPPCCHPTFLVSHTHTSRAPLSTPRAMAHGGGPGCCRGSRRQSTRGPPHEQLLVRLGAGGVVASLMVVFGVLGLCGGVSSWPHRVATRQPLHEQMLVGVGARVPSSSSLGVSPSSRHRRAPTIHLASRGSSRWW